MPSYADILIYAWEHVTCYVIGGLICGEIKEVQDLCEIFRERNFTTNPYAHWIPSSFERCITRV